MPGCQAGWVTGVGNSNEERRHASLRVISCPGAGHRRTVGLETCTHQPAFFLSRAFPERNCGAKDSKEVLMFAGSKVESAGCDIT